MCDPLVTPLTTVPSPKSSDVVRAPACVLGSVQLPVAVTANGAVPVVGATVKVQVGGRFAETVTIWVANPVTLEVFVAETFTVKLPAFA